MRCPLKITPNAPSNCTPPKILSWSPSDTPSGFPADSIKIPPRSWLDALHIPQTIRGPIKIKILLTFSQNTPFLRMQAYAFIFGGTKFLLGGIVHICRRCILLEAREVLALVCTFEFTIPQEG